MSKLTYRNNWEADEYYVDGKRVTKLTSVRINDLIYPVTSKTVSVPYSDHGTTYSGVSTHYFVEACMFGIPRLVDLNEYVNKLNIEAADYEVRQ